MKIMMTIRSIAIGQIQVNYNQVKIISRILQTQD
nr:MAG TPA: hypothetical protein [Caudoviricetes sp.]